MLPRELLKQSFSRRTSLDDESQTPMPHAFPLPSLSVLPERASDNASYSLVSIYFPKCEQGRSFGRSRTHSLSSVCRLSLSTLLPPALRLLLPRRSRAESCLALLLLWSPAPPVGIPATAVAGAVALRLRKWGQRRARSEQRLWWLRRG